MKKKTILLLSALGLSACFGIACLTGITQSRTKETRAVTNNLTGTTWLLNETLTASGVPNFGQANINFTSNNENFDTLDIVLLIDDGEVYYTNDVNNTSIRVYYYEWEWPQYKEITITGGVDVTSSDLIGWLEANATLQTTPETPDDPETPDEPSESESVTFTFDNKINYYAPYQQNIDTLFVLDSEMVSSSTILYKTLIEGVEFTSGGQTFDAIRLYYISAMAQKFINDAGTLSTMNANGFASFMNMVYFNSTTNLMVVVNSRDTPTYSDNNGTSRIQVKASTWVSQSYRYITFSSEISDTTITTLGTLNNASLVLPSVIYNSDVGLGNVFKIMSDAFASWIPVLSIQLIPGITIGLLLFLPLIVGIIVLIIWLVKR